MLEKSTALTDLDIDWISLSALPKIFPTLSNFTVDFKFSKVLSVSDAAILNCLLSHFIEPRRSSILAIGHLLTLVVVCYKLVENFDVFLWKRWFFRLAYSFD